MEIAIKELEPHTRQLIDAVERGEEVTLTYRGKPYARLLPSIILLQATI